MFLNVLTEFCLKVRLLTAVKTLSVAVHLLDSLVEYDWKA